MSDLSLLQSLLNASRDSNKELETALLTEAEGRHRDKAEAEMASESLQEKLGQAERSLRRLEYRLQGVVGDQEGRTPSSNVIDSLMLRVLTLESTIKDSKSTPHMLEPSEASPSDDKVLAMNGNDSIVLPKAPEATTSNHEDLTAYRDEISRLHQLLQSNEEQISARDEVVQAMCTEVEELNEVIEGIKLHNQHLQKALLEQQAVTKESMEMLAAEHDEAIRKFTSSIVEYMKDPSLIPAEESNVFNVLVGVVEGICIRFTEVILFLNTDCSHGTLDQGEIAKC